MTMGVARFLLGIVNRQKTDERNHSTQVKLGEGMSSLSRAARTWGGGHRNMGEGPLDHGGGVTGA